MSLVITSSGVRKVYKPCDFSKVPSIEEVADIFAGIAKGFDFKPITLSGESQPSEGQGDWSENEFTGIAPPNSEQAEEVKPANNGYKLRQKAPASGKYR